MSDDHFLARWSRKKHEARKGEPAEAPAAARAPEPGPVPPAPLPSIESLTPESDFTPFLREGVEDALKRRALKTLFQDPRFNLMDGLDVYIDDYSKPDPLPEGWLEKLNQVARLGEYREPDPDAGTGDPPGETPPAEAADGTVPSVPPEAPETVAKEPSEPEKPV